MGAVALTFSTRPARRKDADAILALYSATLDKHAELHPDHFSRETPVARDLLKNMLSKRSKGAAFVAEEDGAIVGWAGFERFAIPASRNRHDVLGLIIDLTVAEQARGRGVGTALAETLVEGARARGITYLHADVWRGGPSAGVLRRAGIMPVKTVHELRLAERRPGPPPGVRLNRFLLTLLGLLGAVLVGIVIFEVFLR